MPAWTFGLGSAEAWPEREVHLFGNAGRHDVNAGGSGQAEGGRLLIKVAVPFSSPALIPVKYLRVMCLALF